MTPAHIMLGAWKSGDGLQPGLYKINGKSLLIIDSIAEIKNSFPLDYLIVMNLEGIDPIKLQQFYKPKQIVFDNNMSRKEHDRLKNTCNKSNINVYMVADKGAFVL